MSKINLGQDLGLGELPTTEEAALIRHNLKIDVDLGANDPSVSGYEAPIHTLGYVDDGSSPRELKYYKKIGDANTDWAQIVFKEELDSSLENKAVVHELSLPNPSVSTGFIADVGDFGYYPNGTNTTWWVKRGAANTDWNRIALFKDLLDLESARQELDITPSNGILNVDAGDAEVLNATLTEDTEISLAGFTETRTSVILNLTSNGVHDLTWAAYNPSTLDAMAVESAEDTPEVNGVYLRDGDKNNKPRFTKYGGTTDDDSIYWTGLRWEIRNASLQYYTSTDTADTPDEAVFWNPGTYGTAQVPFVYRATWTDIDAESIPRSIVNNIAVGLDITWWSGGEAVDMQNREKARLLIESYDEGNSFDVTVVGEIFI